MSIGWNILGLLTAVASAAAFYATSPHCHWRLSRPRSRPGRIAGVLLAAASLAVWVHAFGAAVGISTALAIWMLAVIALPWLALFAKTAGSTRNS
ncbi:MAG TPA: hypothetical protein VIM92_08170 [Rhodanobacteraceae bacterium]